MKVGLVLEGGSMRALFSAGVLDTFMDEDIKIDGIIGVSAGALFGPNYFSKQKGRALRYNQRFCKDYRNISLLSFFLTGNVVNKKFAYYDITTKYDIFDNETYIKNNTGYYAAVTNIETAQAEYLELKDVLKDMEVLRATAALPILSRIVPINNKKYLDGGIADSIPVLKCKEMGYDKIIVVLTRPIEYRKKPLNDKILKLVKVLYKKYPKFIELMENRHDRYNEQVELIRKMEENNEIFVIRPTKPIHLKTIERNPNDLQEVYDLGIKDCMNKTNELKEYLKGE